jgi:hypothetical protein
LNSNADRALYLKISSNLPTITSTAVISECQFKNILSSYAGGAIYALIN